MVEPTAEATVGPTVEPTVTSTVEPTATGVPLTLDMLQPDRSIVPIGESIRWTFACEGSEQITYAIVNHRQETVAGGDVGASRKVAYTPTESGCYTLAVTASAGEVTLVSESVAYASAGELKVALGTEQR